MRPALALLACAVLALDARADDGADPPAPAKPPAKEVKEVVVLVTHAQWKLQGETLSGWLLARTDGGGVVVVTDGGELRAIANASELQTLASEEASARGVPSKALAAGLGVENEAVRDRCQDLLRAQREQAHGALADALESDAVEARRRSLELLAKLPSQKLSASVRRRLADPDERVRKLALRAYAALEPEDLFDRTRWLIEHDDAVAVLHEAIVTLGRCKDPHGIDVLFDSLDGCDERSLRHAAFDSLRRLAARDFGRDEDAWRAWWTNHRKEIVGSDEPPPVSPRKRTRRVAGR